MATEAALDHRTRLIEAMAASVRTRGYAETTVSDVVRLARTSRRSFYAQFADRQECFLGLVDAVNEGVMGAVAASVEPAGDLEEQIERALAVFLERVSAEPLLFRSFIRELPALGERGAARQLAVVRQFAELLVGLVESVRAHRPQGSTDPLTMDVAIILVGGLRELIVVAIGEGRDVRELLPAAASVVAPVLRSAALHV